MDDKENSVERAYRLMEECDDTVEFLRGCELDIQEQISKAEEELKKIDSHIQKLHEELEEVRSSKMDELYTKMALQMFVRSGGGLDMMIN